MIPPPVRSNTILYCDRWSETVVFYRDTLGFPVTFEADWFVEFELHSGAHLSVADASRTTVAAGDGSGLTLSWQVDDAEAVRAGLIARGVDASSIRARWGSDSFMCFDPSGNRIEYWSSRPA